VWQRFLEASNVNMADELSSVINAQRNYQLNLQSFQTADQMWQLANDMKHG